MDKFKGLSLKDRKELIRKISGLNRIVLYTIDDDEKEKVFGVYDGNRCYKFIICFEKKFVKIYV